MTEKDFKKIWKKMKRRDEENEGENKQPGLFTELIYKTLGQLALLAAMSIIFFIGRKFLSKTNRIKVRSMKSFIESSLDLAGNIASPDDGLGDVFSKSVAIFQHFYNKHFYTDSYAGELKNFVNDETEELTMLRSKIFASVVLPKIEKIATESKEEQFLDEEKTACIMKYTFDVDNKKINIFIVKFQERNKEAKSFTSDFAITKDFDFSRLINLLFVLTENRLFFTLDNTGEVQAEKLGHEENQKNFCLNKSLSEPLLAQLKKFKEKGMQRSYLLYGPPGVGKTSFCLELSEQFCGKILKLDSQCFRQMNSGSMKILLENLDIDFIIVDDIDRLYSTEGLAPFLYTLEAIKDFKNKPTLLATINNIQRMDPAILRPGRFDEIIEFTLPNKEERTRLIHELLTSYSVTDTVSPAQLIEFVKITEGMSHSYLKEYCRQLSIGELFTDIKKKITVRKKYLDKIQVDTVEQDEAEDFLPKDRIAADNAED